GVLDGVGWREFAVVQALLPRGCQHRIVDSVRARVGASAGPGALAALAATSLLARLHAALALPLSLPLSGGVVVTLAGPARLALATLSLPLLPLTLLSLLPRLALLPLLTLLSLLSLLTASLLTLVLLGRAANLGAALLHLGQGALTLAAGTQLAGRL